MQCDPAFEGAQLVIKQAEVEAPLTLLRKAALDSLNQPGPKDRSGGAMRIEYARTRPSRGYIMVFTVLRVCSTLAACLPVADRVRRSVSIRVGIKVFA